MDKRHRTRRAASRRADPHFRLLRRPTVAERPLPPTGRAPKSPAATGVRPHFRRAAPGSNSVAWSGKESSRGSDQRRCCHSSRARDCWISINPPRCPLRWWLLVSDLNAEARALDASGLAARPQQQRWSWLPVRRGRYGSAGTKAVLEPGLRFRRAQRHRRAHRPAIAAWASTSFARTVSVPSLNSSTGRTSHVTSPNSG